MKLKIVGFENEIKFDTESINILEINDVKCFTHLIDILNDKINGFENNEIFLLNDADEEMNMSKEIYMVFDIFNIDYNSKKILNKIYSIIAKNIENLQDTTLENILVKLRKYIIQEVNELPFEFTMKDELEITEILKIYELKIDSMEYTSVLNKIELLIDLLATLKIAQILVIPNLKLYLSDDELVELYKYSLYNNINLLLIERKCDKKLDYENIFLVDNEFEDTYK